LPQLELIGQLTEVAMTVAELRAENKILKDINEKLMQALRIHDVVGQSEQCVLHSTDWQGKCFKCGEQIFVRESK
jgi:hypothetical protein